MVTLWVCCHQMRQKRKKQVWFQICLTRNWRSPFCGLDISWPQTAVLTIHLPGRNFHWKPWSNLLQAALGLQSPSGPQSFLEKYPQKALWDGIPSGAPTTGQTPAQERGEGGKMYPTGPCQSFQVDFADPDMSPLRGLCGNWVGGGEEERALDSTQHAVKISPPHNSTLNSVQLVCLPLLEVHCKLWFYQISISRKKTEDAFWPLA